VGQVVQLTSDSVPNRTFTGKVTATSPQIDPTTRNFSVRATLPNEDNALAPGVFANVQVLLPQQENVITLPKTAVSYTLYGDTAYVLDPKTKSKRHGKIAYQVKKVSITPGMERGNEVAIPQGIQAGDRVVTSGQLKLQDGAWVTLKEDPLKPPETMPLQ
ncbi:MAG: efflux RND transporter periplasmic adaptor subunit, partial [bacterium]|nr:efflux RND transporter periplasmic adaptor subunit [bacterium]